MEYETPSTFHCTAFSRYPSSNPLFPDALTTEPWPYSLCPPLHIDGSCNDRINRGVVEVRINMEHATHCCCITGPRRSCRLAGMSQGKSGPSRSSSRTMPRYPNLAAQVNGVRSRSFGAAAFRSSLLPSILRMENARSYYRCRMARSSRVLPCFVVPVQSAPEPRRH
jgi:hypothetical protein